MKKILLSAVLLAVALPAAAQDVNAAIKARQSHMGLMAFNIGILGSMARGLSDYDADAAQAAADNIVTMTQLNQSGYWPAGSDSDSVAESNALPAIWTDFGGVMERGAALSTAAMNLQAVAGDGLEAMQGALGPLGGACGACHEDYRKPRE